MRDPLRVTLALAFLMLLLSGVLAQDGVTSVPAARQADDVVVITLRGEIDRWTELSVKRRLRQAEASGADAVVIEVDSPGGEVGAVLEICNAIKSSSITNTVAWINPDAYSGGAIVALACRELVTADPARMGDAFPITFGPLGVRGLSPDERTKFLPPLLTEVADSARRNGYDEFLVQAMVVDGIELWSVRDRDTGETWFINEAEYRVLFDGDPPRGKPVLTGVPNGRAADQALAPRSEADGRSQTTAGDAAGEATSEAAGNSPGDAEPVAAAGASTSDGESSPAVERPSGPEAFTPAAPGLVDLAPAVSGNLRALSTRPTFGPGDRGRFVDPVYVSDGTGPIVLSDEHLLAFGFSIQTVQSDEDLRAFLGAKRMIRTEQSWSEAMVRFMMHPIVRGVLIVILLLGLFIEMSSPGMVVPGALALGAFVGIIAPPLLVGMAGWWELAALGVGAVCLLVELLLIPGFGVFGVVGLVALFAGLVGTFIPDGSGGLFSGDREAQTSLLYGVTTVLLSTVTAGTGAYFLMRNIEAFPLLGRLILADPREVEEDPIAAMGVPVGDEPRAGDVGVAASPLRPTGRVRVGERVIEATSLRGFIDAGRSVELVRRDAFAWVVRPVEAGGRTGAGGEEVRA